MAEILDYLGVEKQYTAEEAATVDVSVPNVVGQDELTSKSILGKVGLKYRTVGNGAYVTAQVPVRGNSIPGGSTVILYMGEEPEESGTIPNVVGMGYEAAKKKLEAAGFFMRASGSGTYYGSASKVKSQSVAAGENALLGTVVTVQFDAAEIEDGYVFTD